MQQVQRTEQGFTLIELSIVLVIIGLIVGGVLVGQDLIKAAQIRAEVTQLERYNTAVNTFRSKYNGVPGDLLNATNYFTMAGTDHQSGTAGAGNGDGLVQSLSTSATTQCAAANCLTGESLVFWYELNQAALIPDNTASATDFYPGTLPTISSSYIPNGKVPGTTISVNAINGINYWILANQSGADTAGGLPATNSPGLTPLQAYQIDTKIDDGVIFTGTVISAYLGIPGTIGEANGSATAASATVANNCGAETASTTYASMPATTSYNIATSPNVVNCTLSVRTNF